MVASSKQIKMCKNLPYRVHVSLLPEIVYSYLMWFDEIIWKEIFNVFNYLLPFLDKTYALVRSSSVSS